jgi:hypothetical protein
MCGAYHARELRSGSPKANGSTGAGQAFALPTFAYFHAALFLIAPARDHVAGSTFRAEA